VKIPVFVSCPTTLDEAQQQCRELILRELEMFGLEPRALGRSDYPVDTPLREVLVVARHCSGGVILGFAQLVAQSAVGKPGTDEEASVKALHIPTPWNHLEAGILYGLGLPLLIFREPKVIGGIFDLGTSDIFIHRMPTPAIAADPASGLREVFLKWQARVRQRYYQSS
jgi:hypothetical protein